MPDQTNGDEITLSLPAAPELVRIARLTGAGLATRMGMGYDEVEDVRIAVGEACSLLIGDGSRPGTLVLTFHIRPSAIEVTVAGQLDGPAPGPHTDHDLSDQILAAVADDHRVDGPGDEVWFSKGCGSPTAGPGAG